MNITKCCGCTADVDTDDDYGWSTTQNDYICLSCRENDESTLSTIYLLNKNQKEKYLIGDHIRISDDGDDMRSSGLVVNRQWVSTSTHRGHYDTKIDGWVEVLCGWTTGNWDDPVAQKKIVFNEWVEGLLSGDSKSPVPIALVLDPTSNLFSMGISVLTTAPDDFKLWTGELFDELNQSLA